MRATHILSAIIACCVLATPADAQYEELEESTADDSPGNLPIRSRA